MPSLMSGLIGSSSGEPGLSALSGVVSYSIRVTNAGPSAADGATFADVVPAAITNVSWTCNASGGALCSAASGTGNNIAMTIAKFPMSGELIFLVTGRAPATAQTITNTATITAPPTVVDPDPKDNTSTTTTNVTATPVSLSADLAVTKVGPASVAPFGNVTYTIVVTNKGPDAANNAVLSDLVPAAMTAVATSCVAAQGAVCPATIAAGNTVSATIPTLPAFGVLTFTVGNLLDKKASQELKLNGDLQAWSWARGTASWVEPTAYALLGLKAKGLKGHGRVQVGENFLFDRACYDGGWNYGNKEVLKVVVEPMPTNTCFALLALQDADRNHETIKKSVAYLEQETAARQSSLLLALGILCLEIYGRPVEKLVAGLLSRQQENGSWRDNIHLTALAALALQTAVYEQNIFKL